MRRVGSATSTGAGRGRVALAALAVAFALLAALAGGCTSGPPPAGAAPDTVSSDGVATTGSPEMAPVQLAVVPADKATQVSPADPATVTEVKLVNSTGKALGGELSSDRRTWSSTEALGYAKSYTVNASAVGADGRTVTTTSTFSTVKPRTQTFASLIPTDGQVVGVGQPIAVRFDEPVQNKELAQQSISVRTTPAVDGAFYWFSDKEVHWRPEKYWAPGTKVDTDVKIYGKDLGNGVYGQEDRHISFSIGDAFIAEADGASHQMTVKINGTVVKTMPVSLGKPKVPSYNGVHVVTELHRKKIMDSSTYGVPVDSPDGYRAVVDFAVRISNSGEFVHSAPWSVGDQGRRNVSHGCINASPANAKWFFDTVKKGDIVVITNSGGPDLRADDGFGDWNIPWSQWVAGGKK